MFALSSATMFLINEISSLATKFQYFCELKITVAMQITWTHLEFVYPMIRSEKRRLHPRSWPSRRCNIVDIEVGLRIRRKQWSVHTMHNRCHRRIDWKAKLPRKIPFPQLSASFWRLYAAANFSQQFHFTPSSQSQRVNKILRHSVRGCNVIQNIYCTNIQNFIWRSG